MRLRSIVLAGLAALVSQAFAEVITFEDVPGSFTNAGIFSPYHGFSWSGNLLLANEALFPGSDAHSGSTYGWSNGPAYVLMTSSTPFDFTSLWAREGSSSGSNDRFVVHGYTGGVEAYAQVLDETMAYQFYALNFNSVDKVVINAIDYRTSTNLLIDDINVSAPASIPEPGTLALALAALCGVGWWSRFGNAGTATTNRAQRGRTPSERRTGQGRGVGSPEGSEQPGCESTRAGRCSFSATVTKRSPRSHS